MVDQRLSCDPSTMASCNIPLIAALLLLVFFGTFQVKGDELKCDKDSLTVETSKTGNTVGGKPEYKVEITNGCHCKNGDIRLDCKGFQTAKPVDPASMQVQGDQCVLTGFIPPYQSTFFTYAWDEAFPFTPVSCQPDCS